MNYLRSFFKRKKEENVVIQQNKPLPLQIMNFKYIHNGMSIIPKINTSYFQIKLNLEKKYQACESWTLAYSTYNNGYSLKTLHLFLSGYKGPFLFVIQECNGNCFGVFFEESLEIRKAIFGRKSTFLYKIDKKPTKKCVKHIVTDNKINKHITNACECKNTCKEVKCCKSEMKCKKCDTNIVTIDKNHFEFGDSNYTYTVKKYTATDKNIYFCNSSPDFLAFGCSNGYYGLLLNSDLQTGESHRVDTFDNDVLSTNTKFMISEIEIWNLTL